MFCKPPHPVYIVLFRGDDTDFVGNQEIIVKITTERNISGCKAYFKYMGNIQTFDAIPEDKELHLVFSREQTKDMPLGTWDAELYLIDENGKRMTVNNRIHMLVTNSVGEAYFPDDPQAVSVVISANKYIEDAEVSADGKTLTLTKKDGTEVSFSGGGSGGGTNDYNDLENKPSINGTTLTGNVNLATPEQLSLKADKANVYTKAEVDDKVDAVDNKADAAYSAAESLADGVNSLAGTIGTHIRDAKNPHKVTAAQVGALALDSGNTVRSSFSVDFPNETSLGGNLSFRIGSGPSGMSFVVNNLYCSSAFGFYADGIVITNPEGTAGASVLGRIQEYGGDFKTARAEVDNLIAASAATKADKATTLAGYGITNAATEAYVDDKVRKAVLPTDPTFSNAVLAVGLNIDTNSVAVLNEIAEMFGGFPIEGTATTVGGLLAALAAAVAWLRKKKIDKLTVTGMSKEVTADGGVAKLDDFFTNSNSLLTATIDARLPYPINAVPSTGVLKDRAINTTSLASVTVPDNFTDLLIRASVASSLSVTMPEAITTKYGDTFPGEAGEYLITITKTGAAEAYVRTIKLEVANA